MAVWGQPFRISQTHNKNKRSLPHYILTVCMRRRMCLDIGNSRCSSCQRLQPFRQTRSLAVKNRLLIHWRRNDIPMQAKKNLPQSHMWECKTLLLQSTHSAKRVNLHHLLNSMKHYIQHIILLSFQYYVVLLAPHENFVGGVKTRSKRKSHISWWVEIEHFFSLSEKVCVSMQFILLLLLLFSRSRFIHTNNRFTHGNQINP